MASIGLDPARFAFGAHSLRIGGATAAPAAGVQPTLIRVLGRWSSDIYEIYCRLSLEAAVGMGALVGPTPFEDVEQGEFVTEDLEATSLELAAFGLLARRAGPRVGRGGALSTYVVGRVSGTEQWYSVVGRVSGTEQWYRVVQKVLSGTAERYSVVQSGTEWY
jgi:hypothetical protein